MLGGRFCVISPKREHAADAVVIRNTLQLRVQIEGAIGQGLGALRPDGIHHAYQHEPVTRISAPLSVELK
jgi:hypothetical protein